MTRYQFSCSLIGHENDVRSVDSPRDDMVISGSRDGTARLWRPRNGKWKSSEVEERVVYQSMDRAFVNSVATVDFGEGPLVATGGKDCIIYINGLEPVKGESLEDNIRYQLVGHENNVCSLHSVGTYLISSSWDATAHVWDFNTMDTKYVLRGHESSVWDAKVVDFDNSIFLTCSADRTIRKWAGEKELFKTTAHDDVVRKLLVLPDGKQFVSCSNDGTIRIWDLDNGRLLSTLSGHESFVYDVAVAPNGDLISSGEDRTVRVWRNGTIAQVITLPCISLWSVSVMSNGDIVVGGSDNSIRIFSAEPERSATEAEIEEFNALVQNSAISEQSIDNLNKTDLPDYEALKKPGAQEGSTIMVNSPSGKIEAHQWSGGAWVKIGDVVGSAGSKGQKHEFNGNLWDYLFDVDIADGAPPLKLPYNSNENPYTAAERFLADNELPASYKDEVVRFIMQNTGGVSLDRQGVDAGTGASNPVTDSEPKKVKDTVKGILPQTSFIDFKTFKGDSIVNGLRNFNEAQVSEAKLSEEEISDIQGCLNVLASSDAVKIVTQYVPKITSLWESKHKLVGYDLLRISLPRITTADVLRSMEIAEVVQSTIDKGISSLDENNLTTLMMIARALSNLMGGVLFVQIYMETDEQGNLSYSVLFEKLIGRITEAVQRLSLSPVVLSSKHFPTAMTAVATLLYNLTAYTIKTPSLSASKSGSQILVDFMEALGETIADSNEEAAYRVTVAYGNLKHGKVLSAPPKFYNKVKQSYVAERKIERFVDIVNNIESM
ncbi:Piso0_005399 [Millerozyma farinosa CBS 7064]|uniref:Piso0_005399 protein n=1 Tax=Pichia sorbitophila (strain ATCC MYA-4447 / BCRC 22081 / CBS 7064 / NBRC 10061 / NRRL Y-12695) TaxID=559304 RepID=G8Y503_PICSO|nr:Piso0_005399 [Millerozyma farinosa CBS 7064]